MLTQGAKLSDIAANVVVKVPATWDGFRACRALSERGARVNVTLCFSANQALLAGKAGATFISPFVGRLDDLGLDGMELVREIRAIFHNYRSISTEILASSIRTPLHVKEAAVAGADIVTLPPTVLRSLAQHPLTDKGLASFLVDWRSSGQAIS
jgi:transaldolase